MSVRKKTRKRIMRLSKVAALALIVGATSFMSVSLALAASDCPTLAELVDWGENSTGDISLASGGSCLFSIRIRGTASGSDVLQKPVHGKLKKINITTYEYNAQARYKGSRGYFYDQSNRSRADGIWHVGNYRACDDQIRFVASIAWPEVHSSRAYKPMRCGGDLTNANGLTHQQSQKSPQDPQLLRPMRSIGFAHRPNAGPIVDRQGRSPSHVWRGSASAT